MWIQLINAILTFMRPPAQHQQRIQNKGFYNVGFSEVYGRVLSQLPRPAQAYILKKMYQSAKLMLL